MSHTTASMWSLAGFATTVLAGIGANVAVENLYGRPALGLFSTCLSIVIIGGQMGSLGQHNATLYHVSAASEEGQETAAILGAALRITARTSIALASVMGVFAAFVLPGHLSDTYQSGILSTIGALALFPVNKVLVAYLNGHRRFRQTSIANAMRFSFILGWVLVNSAASIPWRFVPLALSLAEASLFGSLFLMNGREFAGALRSSFRAAEPVHRVMRRFGLRSLPAALFLDINTRVDVLVLSLLKGADAVGKYTIASALSEGLYQMCMATRLVVEPQIAGFSATGKIVELRGLLKRHALFVYCLAIPATIVAMIAYGPVAGVLYGRADIVGTAGIFMILSLGVVVAAGFIPLTNLFQQMGDPIGQSRLLISLSTVNLVANLLLVPSLGGIGSALGTAIAQVLLVPLLVLGYRSRAQRLTQHD